MRISVAENASSAAIATAMSTQLMIWTVAVWSREIESDLSEVSPGACTVIA